MISLKKYSKHLEKIQFDVDMLNRHVEYLLDEGEVKLGFEVQNIVEELVDYLIWLRNNYTDIVSEVNPSAMVEENITVFDGKRYSILEVM